MAWRDNLQDANFRGASFKVLNANTEIGKRTVIHQFVNRDIPYYEDLGKEADTFRVDAYVVQNTENSFDYMRERDALIDALKRKGTGTLVHPFYGVKKVGVQGKAQIAESFEEGGIARFSITFIETPSRDLPSKIQRVADLADRVENAINEVNDKLGDTMNLVYRTTGAFMDISANVVSKAMEVVQTGLTGFKELPTKVLSQVTGNINSMKSGIANFLSFPGDVFNSLKNTASSFGIACGFGKSIKASIEASYGTPGEDDKIVRQRYADTFANSLDIPLEIVGGETGAYSGLSRGEITELTGSIVPHKIGKAALTAIADAYNNYALPEYVITPAEQVPNIVLISNILKFGMIANACNIAIRTKFRSQEDVIYSRDLISELMNNYLIELGDQASGGGAAVNIGSDTTQIDNAEIFESVMRLLNIFIEGMNEKISKLAEAIDYNSKYEGDNCLTLAYDKYFDIERTEEIFDLNYNEIRHPGFIPANTTLRILSE